MVEITKRTKLFLVFLCILINILYFTILFFNAKTNVCVALKKPHYNSEWLVLFNDKEKIIPNEDINYVWLKIPYGVKHFEIKNLDKNEISYVQAGGRVTDFENAPKAIEINQYNNAIELICNITKALCVQFILLALFFISAKTKPIQLLLSKDFMGFIKYTRDWLSKNVIGNKTIFWASVCVLFCFIALHFYYIYKYAVNIPHYDAWEFLDTGVESFKEKRNIGWFFIPHWEHRIFWTKLTTWLSYIIDGWNIRHLIFVNFIIKLAGCFMLYKIIPNKFSFLPLFFIPLFSDACIYNSLTYYQNQIYFMLLFSFLAIYYGFKKDNLPLFIIFTWCAVYSMTIAAGAALFLAYVIKEGKINKKVLIAGFFTLILVISFFTHSNGIGILELTYPTEPLFWFYMGNLIARGILNIRYFDNTAVCYLVLLTFVWGLSLIHAKYKTKDYTYFALFLLSLTLMASITLGRASFLGNSIASRHITAVIYLIPAIAGFLASINAKISIVAYLVLTCFNFSNSFSDEMFKHYQKERLEVRQDVFRILNNPNEKYKYLSFKNLTPFILRAKELNCSFTKL